MTTGTIVGTTISGHAAATTLGNSLRQYYAHLYCLQGLPHGLVVSGDDTVIRLASKALPEFYQRYWSTHSPAMSGSRGIGLCSTGLVVNPHKTPFRTISFLSKDFMGIPGSARLARPPERLVTADFIEAKKLGKKFTKAQAAQAVTLGNNYLLNDPVHSEYQKERIKQTGIRPKSMSDLSRVYSHYQLKTQQSTRNHNDFAGVILATYERERNLLSHLAATRTHTKGASLSSRAYSRRFPCHPFSPLHPWQIQLAELCAWIDSNN